MLLSLAIMLACVAAAMSLGGCGPKREPCTEPGATRCLGSEVQHCDPSSEWSTVDDCSQVEPGEWSCQQDEQGQCVCLPEEADK